MTKAELIRALKPFSNDAEIMMSVVCKGDFCITAKGEPTSVRKETDKHGKRFIVIEAADN